MYKDDMHLTVSRTAPLCMCLILMQRSHIYLSILTSLMCWVATKPYLLTDIDQFDVLGGNEVKGSAKVCDTMRLQRWPLTVSSNFIGSSNLLEQIDK